MDKEQNIFVRGALGMVSETLDKFYETIHKYHNFLSEDVLAQIEIARAAIHEALAILIKEAEEL